MKVAECLDCGEEFTPTPEEPDFCWRCSSGHAPLAGDPDWKTRAEAKRKGDWTFTNKEAA